MRSTQNYSPASDADIKRAADTLRRELHDARFVLVGTGAGFSASAGLNYVDEDFFPLSLSCTCRCGAA